jgi:hypothetical protein
VASLAICTLALLCGCALAALAIAWLAALQPFEPTADEAEYEQMAERALVALSRLWLTLALTAVPLLVCWPGTAACASALKQQLWNCASAAALALQRRASAAR